ncbi:type II toxin-antitoxin system HicB family antitoxin [candidate division WOR-3 bacterium]|nr:type II toxin-antitoxin system HicB family antitoxin [candidate division WOR-3 bacterium]
MSSKSAQDLAHYLGLKYPVEVTEQAEGGFFVRVPDLPGCMSQGETVEEALANIDEARRLWLEVAHESGDDIPVPGAGSEFSGKFVLRVPRYLHEALSRAADREDVSLNTYVLGILSSGHATRNVAVRLEKACSVLERLSKGLTKVSWNLGRIVHDSSAARPRAQGEPALKMVYSEAV